MYLPPTKQEKTKKTNQTENSEYISGRLANNWSLCSWKSSNWERNHTNEHASKRQSIYSFIGVMTPPQSTSICFYLWKATNPSSPYLPNLHKTAACSAQIAHAFIVSFSKTSVSNDLCVCVCVCLVLDTNWCSLLLAGYNDLGICKWLGC